ncbi:TonB-dependent receptor [Methylibium sp. T29]|uniref:TonB-dependent receptor n=1 Tax=Methylibium sp. T29 TaxID=1430884 RepID=UPI0004AEEB9A|nr:TonB-dependent receptor [Methylibium sp. T29]
MLSLATLASPLSTLAQQAPAAAASAPEAAPSDAAVRLNPVLVPGKRATDVGPMPGLAVTKDQIPANIQSATKEQIKESRALNIGDYMNTQLQGVSVNDYAGNPFQMDVNYRGFTASPQIGTPQGLSVFFDGVRVNEPFGDVVNWDLIPLNAIERFDLFPGSNPLFGLNTLGGAISVRSKNGFTAPGVEGELLAGSWGRRQVKLSAGGNDDTLGGFVAYTGFREDGWRDNSPSRVHQLFGRGDLRLDRGSLFASALFASNELIGNGLIPLSLYEQRAETVFTSPDRSDNRVLQLALGGQFDVSERFNITGQLYTRKSRRGGLNGDIYEGFDDMIGLRGGYFDPDNPAAGVQPRNGAYYNTPGVITGTPIGLLTDTALDQRTHGASLQFNWNLPTRSVMVGASIDRSRSTYSMFQRLGLIDATHGVYADPAALPAFIAAQMDIPGNNFEGTSTTKSLYASDTWTLAPQLTLTTAARYNHTTVDNQLLTRTVEGLVDLHELPANYDNAQTLTAEKFSYRSLNPSIGLNWLPAPGLNTFANVSRGSRTPSVVELGCAFDDTPTPVTLPGATPNDPPVVIGTTARSLLGPGCNLPTTLSGDPYLPQIRSTSFELGARGLLSANWEWNASLFRTDLKDDIYYVGVGQGRSYFDTIGKTRRQGLELGLAGARRRAGREGQLLLHVGDLRVAVLHDEPAQQQRGLRPELAHPGRPGLPRLPVAAFARRVAERRARHLPPDPGEARRPHAGHPGACLNFNLGWRVTPSWKLGLGMQLRSMSYVRGNENNLHRPGGTDQETGQYYCSTNAQTRACDQSDGGYIQTPTRPGRTFTQKGTVPGFAVFNLDTSVVVTKGFTVVAQVTNLFDRRYVTAGNLGVNPFSPSTVGAIGVSGWNYNSAEWQPSTFVGPGAPRGIFLGLSYALGAD